MSTFQIKTINRSVENVTENESHPLTINSNQQKLTNNGEIATLTERYSSAPEINRESIWEGINWLFSLLLAFPIGIYLLDLIGLDNIYYESDFITVILLLLLGWVPLFVALGMLTNFTLNKIRGNNYQRHFQTPSLYWPIFNFVNIIYRAFTENHEGHEEKTRRTRSNF